MLVLPTKFMVYSSFAEKNLDLLLGLCFSHASMPAKFEPYLLSIATVINHAWYIISRFVIFVLDEIIHI